MGLEPDVLNCFSLITFNSAACVTAPRLGAAKQGSVEAAPYLHPAEFCVHKKLLPYVPVQHYFRFLDRHQNKNLC